jgi:xanthine dehydrogenase YagR molybdenum-binding subunit
LSSLGAKAQKKAGITVLLQAIVNAVYHANGKRMKDIPIMPDKLIS